MPLFQVEVSANVVVEAEDAQQAVLRADNSIRDMHFNGEFGFDVLKRIEYRSDLPMGWADVAPYGAFHGLNLTCGDILVSYPPHDLVPVYPGPDLKEGDTVYFLDGIPAVVERVTEDDGVLLKNGGYICASNLYRKRLEAA